MEYVSRQVPDSRTASDSTGARLPTRYVVAWTTIKWCGWPGDSPGEFKRVHQTEDTAFGYSPLDLYLMGVRPSSSVKDIRVFSADLDVQDGVPFAATPKVITISDITAAYGERSPAPAGPRHTSARHL